jgi:methylase of polypeptide subunit release factors
VKAPTVTPDVAALRADLAPHTVESIAELIGPVAVAALDREQAVPALRATEGRELGLIGPGLVGPRTDASATTALLRLFVLGAGVTRAQLDQALPRTGTAGCARLGLIEAAGNDADDAVRALVDLQPYATQDAAGSVQWWLASDRGELATGRSLRPDHVLGVGGASLTLARATVREPRHRVLDLGTGCGVQALHATRHSAAVVGTDVSPRALRFAAFNAALAGVAIELREGSLLEPVAGETFDLVVSNPPFVITPRTAGGVPRFEYRDGGLAGDDVVRDLVTGVGAVLEPGGVAQLLANWEHRRGQDWRDRVGEWLDAAGVDAEGLDAWVVQREVLDPAEYAETWLRDGGTTSDRDPAAWESGYRAWLDDFEARDVEAVGFGLVVLRKPAQAGARTSLRRLEDVGSPVARPLGEHVASVLRAHDWLTAHDDAALADARLVVAPDVVEDRHHTPGSADPAMVRLRQGDGFARAVTVGTAVAAVVGACDGELSLGPIIGAVAGLLGRPTAEVTAEVLPVVRDLLLDGFLRVG